MNRSTSLLKRTASACGFAFALMAIPTTAGAETISTAVVNTNGTLARGTDGAKSARTGLGLYRVIFNHAVTTCAFVATVGSANSTKPQGGSAKVYSLSGNPKGVSVGTGAEGSPSDRGFHLVVVCP